MSRGIKMGVVKKKIQIELLWNQLVVNKYSKDVKIDKNQIKKKLIKISFKKNY